MSKKVINLEHFTSSVYLNRYVEDVDRKIEELMELANRATKSDENIKALMLLKKNQEAVWNRCKDLSLKDLDADFKKFKGAEDYLNQRSNELMIQFTKSEGLEEKEHPGVLTAVEGELLSESGRNREEGRPVLMESRKDNKNKKGQRDPDLKIERLNELNEEQKSRNSRLMDEERKSKETLIEFDNVEGVNLKDWLVEEKTKAIKIATKLSLRLVDFMLFMSERKETQAKFQEFLESVIEDEKSPLLNMVISVTVLVGKELREIKEIEKVKTESLERSSVNMEEMEQKGRLYNESKFDQFIDHLMKEFVGLEYIMKLIGLSSFFSRSDESGMHEIWKGVMKLKIKERIGEQTRKDSTGRLSEWFETVLRS